jgi:Mg-chelatase subunit ChlD
MHALLTPDEQYVLTNRWSPAELNVVDLRSRITTTLSLGHDAEIAGGFALNRAMGDNEGLLAMHANSRVMVFEVELPDVVRLVGSAPVPGGGVVWEYAARGPLAAIAWSGDGSKLIAAAGLSSVGGDSSEFVVYDVTQGGERIQERTSLVACPWAPMANRPNDILTANGKITPVATPTGSPSPTVTVTTSPTATDTATSLPPSPTPTPQRVQVFLPIALTETCDPRHQRSDIALVIDTSSSMSGHKIEDARAAALTFVGLIDLAPGRSQVAVVRFDREAEVVRELTNAPALIEAAIRNLQVRSGTHIDKGLRTALGELQSPRHLGRNAQVLILLTDGVQTGTPGEELRAAEEVRAAGVRVYSIGLGADVDAATLRTIAGADERYYFAPASGDLAQIYGEIARDLMCPGVELWGGR